MQLLPLCYRLSLRLRARARGRPPSFANSAHFLENRSRQSLLLDIHASVDDDGFQADRFAFFRDDYVTCDVLRVPSGDTRWLCAHTGDAAIVVLGGQVCANGCKGDVFVQPPYIPLRLEAKESALALVFGHAGSRRVVQAPLFAP